MSWNEPDHTHSHILNSGRGADMTVICQSTKFRYHSVIVRLHSEYFAPATWENLKEGDLKRIKLRHAKHSLVGRMMSNFYVLNYDEDEVEEARTTLEVNAQMYGMADKYGIVGLRGLARVKFNHSCKKIIFGGSWLW
ncbi:MAG: hypothetical protein Q9185_003456 [Variospora sp. 1 TL-2023]